MGEVAKRSSKNEHRFWPEARAPRDGWVRFVGVPPLIYCLIIEGDPKLKPPY
jgi:hypothetical protein